MNPVTLREILQPRPVEKQPRIVQPAKVQPGSMHERIVADAAEKIRHIYIKGQRRVAYDERNPEQFFDACFDTRMTVEEVEQCIEDERVARIALAIFHRAGITDNPRPTTLRAQVEMQIAVVEAARNVQWLFAQQQALEV